MFVIIKHREQVKERGVKNTGIVAPVALASSHNEPTTTERVQPTWLWVGVSTMLIQVA